MSENTLLDGKIPSQILIQSRTIAWGTSLPTSWPMNGTFFLTTNNTLYTNVGTKITPIWDIYMFNTDELVNHTVSL